MAEGKVSKTARASMQKAEKQLGKRCPGCGEPMTATKVIKSWFKPSDHPEDNCGHRKTFAGEWVSGGMFWICDKCNHRERVHKK